MKLHHSLILLPFSLLPLTAFVFAFSDGPLPALTGGFREETCHSCHNSFPVNEGRTRGGVFQVIGVPKSFEGGRTYPITVLLGHPRQSRWGFELSARFANSGAQAGQLVPVDDKTQMKDHQGIQYIQHTVAGTRGGTLHGPVEFQLNWIAPEQTDELVIFNAAGNAADGSGDPIGDYVYTAGGFSLPAGETPLVLTQAEEPEFKQQRLNTSSRFVHLPAPVDLQKGAWELHIEHRFLQPLVDAGFGNAFGADSGANINLGFQYALTDRLSVGTSRARFGKIVAFNGTFEIHHPSDSFWKMSMLAGIDGESNFQTHYSPHLQLPVSFDYKRLRTYVVPTVIFNSRPDVSAASRADAINPEDNHTFALGLGADLALHRRFSLTGEYIPRLSGFGGFGPENAALSWGFKVRTFGHVFTILVSNNQNFTPALYGVNAGGSNFVLGFNIYRRR